MLVYTAIGPMEDGNWFVSYPTPGLDVPTTVCLCSTAAQAEAESARLNAAAVEREIALRDERRLCGLAGVYFGKEDHHG